MVGGDIDIVAAIFGIGDGVDWCGLELIDATNDRDMMQIIHGKWWRMLVRYWRTMSWSLMMHLNDDTSILLIKIDV